MTFQDYAQYSLTEFLEDSSFIQWVIHPDDRSNLFWHSFLTQYPDKEAMVHQASSMIRTYRQQELFTNEEHREELWKRIDATVSSKKLTSAKREFNIPIYMKVAASIALLIACSLTIWMEIYSSTKTIITTTFGEVKAVTLPDQSIVMLNGNSLLTYKNSWDENEPREVWISGEAYFDIKHTNMDTSSVLPGQRFMVHSNGIDIQVLGTSFNVRSRRNKTNIALLNGKIEVSYVDPTSTLSEGLVMLPGDYVEYAGQKLLTKKKLARPHKAATWTVREITFTDPSLKDIIEMLQDIYGYSVEVSDQHLMVMKIEGEISVTSVEELLSLVSSTLGISIEESGKELIIEQKHPTKPN